MFDNSIKKTKQTILVVDDIIENIDLLKDVLDKEFNVKAALNGEQALKIIKNSNDIDMILLDIMMPKMDGYEVCKRIKENPVTSKIPIIFVTAMNERVNEEKGLSLGAVDYITKPIHPAITISRIKTHLALYDQNRILENKVKERTEELEDTRLSIIRQLGRAAEYKDNETGMHIIRMSHYSRLIAESIFGEQTEWSDLVYKASPMHDIGKIGIPDGVLLKTDKLNDEEWALMKKHPEIGADIIGNHESKLLQMAKEIALTHHEKYNGKGYPYGLKGEEIPLSGRIVAVADVFDALTSERPYKKAWDIEKAIKFIKDQSGEQFDPKIVECFINVLSKILEVKDKFSDNYDLNNI